MHGDYVCINFILRKNLFIKKKDAGMTSTIKRNMSQYSCLRRVSKVQVYLYNIHKVCRKAMQKQIQKKKSF